MSITPVVSFGSPTPIREVLENYAPSVPRQYDITPDGKMIGLIPANQPQTGAAAGQIQVVLNWFEELNQRVK